MKTNLLVEQHFHGCYGINFNTASVDDILYLAQNIIKEGIGYIFPTLVTDSIVNTKRQIDIIKKAALNQTSDMARICGIHLEGIFLNPQKKGIHDERHFLKPTIQNYELLADDFIKIITIAPELSDKKLLKYLSQRGIKVQAGHCIGGDLSYCNATTHTFNAMSEISHKKSSTVLSALLNDDIYTEIIADGIHVCDDALKLLIKTKPKNKILLVSDCLPCTHSNLREFEFAGENIMYNGTSATSKDGVLAGSTKLLPDIIKIMAQKGIFNSEYINNSYSYHNLEPFGKIEWNTSFDIVEVKY